MPGCCGSMNVVHVKWSSCPTGDHNQAKGKAGHPTLAFECITDYNCRVIGIFGRSLALVTTRRLSRRWTQMCIALRLDGTRMCCGNITMMMEQVKMSKVRILFATMDIIAGQFLFPPTPMLIVVQSRGTSQQFNKS